jgi:hypothetical protein
VVTTLGSRKYDLSGRKQLHFVPPPPVGALQILLMQSLPVVHPIAASFVPLDMAQHVSLSTAPQVEPAHFVVAAAVISAPV